MYDRGLNENHIRVTDLNSRRSILVEVRLGQGIVLNFLRATIDLEHQDLASVAEWAANYLNVYTEDDPIQD